MNKNALDRNASLLWRPGAAPPRSGWQKHPNLRRRPAAPARGRGRLQRQVARAFIGGEVLSASAIYNWTHARRRQAGEPISGGQRQNVRRILERIALRVGRAGTRGRPWLWKLKP
jgi:hypothetical protein